MLPKAKRDEMKMAYFEHRTDTAVHNICHVHMRTVRRYREIDKWDEWCERMDDALDKRMLKKAVAAREDSLRMARSVKAMMAQDLKAKINSGEPVHFATREFVEIVKLEELLMGSATERRDNTFNSREEVQAFVDQLPASQRERLANNGTTVAGEGIEDD